MYKLSFLQTGAGIVTLPFPSRAGPFSINPKSHLLSVAGSVSAVRKLFSCLNDSKTTRSSKALVSPKTTMGGQLLC